jgi:hypothetical protein
MSVAIAYYTLNNFNVSIPLTDNQSYDFLIEKDNVIFKVQVKTSSYKTSYGIYNVGLKTCGGNKSGSSMKYLDKSKIDYLFIMCDNSDCYNIPASDITSSGGTLNMGKHMQKFKIKLFQ